MSEQRRIGHVDAWRFIAVTMVIGGHLLVHSNFSFIIDSFPFLRRLGRFGTLGVLIFFFISGFVICRGLMKERATTSGISLKAFYVRRSFRILPPLWLFLLVLALLASLGGIDITSAQIGKSALFLCNMHFSGSCSWYAGHTWSLAYEEQFYLAFPMLFLFFDLTRRRSLALLIVFVCMVLSIERRLSGHTFAADYLMNMCFLLSGCVAALYEPEVRRIAGRVTFVHWSIVGGGGLVACVGLLPHPLELYAQAILYPPLIAILVLATPLHRPRVRSFFHHRLIVHLGRISYTVYLWQQLATAPWPGSHPAWTLVFILGVWLFAHLSWRWFERPLIRIGAGWSDSILAKRQTSLVSMAR